MLDDLYLKYGHNTRMISAENPTGEKGKACLDKIDPSNPRLYWSKNAIKNGYKVCPFVRLMGKSTLEVANYRGSGIIKQIFFTSDKPNFSDLVLRIYWDDEEYPSVECPLGAFFCMGHNKNPHNVYSLPIVVAPHRGCNSYFRMPFKKGFRITIENESEQNAEIIAYKIIFDECEVDDKALYFHAQYRHTLTISENPTHIILDNVEGEGIYVGTYLAWSELHERWWGEGEVKFYLDDDKDNPTICDNGTEDYFGGAWNFGGYGIIPNSNEVEFNSPFLGLPLAYNKPGEIKRFSMYRFHIEDSICFNKNIKVTVDTIGWKEDFSSYEHHDEDVKSVAYYYQNLPHKKFNDLEKCSNREDFNGGER